MMQLPYQHWFWDFDGTLYDTYARIVRTFQQGLQARGIHIADGELLRRLKGTMLATARTFGDEALAQELIDDYNRNAIHQQPETMRAYPGAAEALRLIQELGGQHYLYTHRDSGALKALEEDGLLPLFSDAVTSEDDFPRKPAPDALLHLVGEHKLQLKDCCMVGDRPIDLDAARNAGMAGILFDPDAFYPDLPCAHRFTSYAAMLRWLRRGNKA